MPENTAIQVNYRLGDMPLVNVYATDEQDAESLLESLERLAPEIAAAGALLAEQWALSGVSRQLGGTPVQAAPQQAPQGGPPAPSCAHGPMVHRTGNGPRGAWGGYFCPVNDKSCKVHWDPKR